MSDPPLDGDRPRGTLPLGPGPFPSPAAPRRAERATSLARLALARFTRRPAVQGVLAVLLGLVPIALAVRLSALPAAPSPSCVDAPELRPAAEYVQARPLGPELPELREGRELPAELRPDAMPRPAPVARVPRVPRPPASSVARPKPSSDVVDPWRK